MFKSSWSSAVSNESRNQSIAAVTSNLPWSIPVRIMLATIVACTSAITVVANVLVIYAYFTTRALRTYTNYYILNLAILDLIGGLFPMPIYGAYWILGHWPLDIHMCDIYLWVNHTTINATVLSILIIAVDRFRSVVFPIKHFQQRTLKHAIPWISLCYIIPFFVWTPTIFIWPAVGGRSFPGFVCQPEYINSFGFSAFAQLELFWVPVIAMIVLYAKIIFVYKRRMGAKKYEKKIHVRDTVSDKTDSVIGSVETSKNAAGISEDMSSVPVGDLNSLNGSLESRKLESRRMRLENNRAVRTLTLIFAVFLAAGLPWAILVIVFRACPSCIPLAVYQVSKTSNKE